MFYISNDTNEMLMAEINFKLIQLDEVIDKH